MEIKGKIISRLEEQTGQGKNGIWKKQSFILETQDQYPKKVCISAWGDKINLNNFTANDLLTVSFDLESREYNGKWYTDAKAWKIEKAGGNDASDNMEQLHPEEDFIPPDSGNNDLPF